MKIIVDKKWRLKSDKCEEGRWLEAVIRIIRKCSKKV